MKIIGHRGAKGLAPENTASSILKALECNVDMIEIDVRYHNSNFVLSHSPTTNSGNYCSLNDGLTSINGQVPVILEIKEFEVLNDKFIDIINQYEGKIIFSSKKFSVLYELHKRMPEVQLAITEKWSSIRAVAEASLLHTEQIHQNHNWLWSSFVRSMKQRGFEIYAYTVNSTERAQELKEWGVDAIFTDYPNRFTK